MHVAAAIAEHLPCPSHLYVCIRFKILLAAFCKSIPHFSNDILSLYDFCMTFVYYFMPYIYANI